LFVVEREDRAHVTYPLKIINLIDYVIMLDNITPLA
jgi:hypothetical protein